MTDQTISTTLDTFLDESAKDTPRDSGHLNYQMGGVNAERNPIMVFDVSSLAGKMWDSAVLNLTYFSNGLDPSAGGQIFLSVVSKAVVITEATWNEYSSGNGWGIVGAESSADNHHGTRVEWTTLTGTHSTNDVVTSPDITDLVKRALFTNAGTLNLIMYGSGSNTNTQQFDGVETAGGSQASILFTNVEDQETTTSSNPTGTADNVAVPSATATSKSGRPPIAGADRQVSASVIHDGVEPMTILAITLKGQFGADN